MATRRPVITYKFSYKALLRSTDGLPIFIKRKPNNILEIELPEDNTGKALERIKCLLKDWFVGLEKI